MVNSEPSKIPEALSNSNEYSRTSSSGSSALKSIVKSVSSSIICPPINDKTGGSLTGITLSVNVVESDKYPSETKTFTSISPSNPENGLICNVSSDTYALAFPSTETL